MPEHEQLDLEIILEIVRYLRMREERATRNNGEITLIAELVRKLSSGVSIESLLNSQTIHVQEAVVSDYYNVGQAGAVGRNSIAVGQNFTQVWSGQENKINLDVLAQELRKVRDSGRVSASGTPEEDVALAELAHAEIAATNGDGSKALSHLARAGQWALRIAVTIGVPVAVKALEAALGFEAK
jgi:hypothetical protein